MIKLTSIQAPNQDFIIATLARYLDQKLDYNVSTVLDIPWQERERLLDAGDTQIGWICGLPYVRKVAAHPNRFELLAAPVMEATRYQMRPIYFSDVVVHASSPFHSFAGLRGASWAYNEPGSHSGYNLPRYHLATLNENETYFSATVAAGSHQAALELVLQGQIDASAIDSTVLEQEIRNRPTIGRQIRIIETLGPSPIPPLVINRQVPVELRRSMQTLILSMHQDPAGQKILSAARIAKFVPVTDSDYDPIREMDRLGQHVHL